MLLTLEVVGANASALGAHRRKIIGSEGATIGRSRNNDWVIANQYISRTNARIHSVEGAFYIEGLGLNQLAMHEATHFVANHEPQLLRNGDRFFLGPYEIRVTIDRQTAQVPRVPFVIQRPAQPPRPAQVVSRHGESTATGSPNPPADLHSLATQWRPTKHGELQQGSLAEGTYQMPRPIVDGSTSADTEPESQRASRSASEDSADAQANLDLLLQSAGLSGAKMTPEIAAEIGGLLRVVVQGVMDVLHSRAEIKTQLHMSVTRIQSTENNPLKFSPNVEAALHTLLVERNAGYLPLVRSFQEALFDIRNHQVAVLEGIRVAYDSVLEQFDPAHIESGMQRHSNKARFRDRYVAWFAQLTQDRDESFRSLFREPFAQAYEAQMDRLSVIASPKQPSSPS